MEFLRSHSEDLMKLRYSLDDIVPQYQAIIDSPPNNSLVLKKKSDITYVGIHLLDNSELINIIKLNDKNWKNKDLIVAEHLTQAYLGKKGQTTVKLISEGKICMIYIDALVVNKSNGASAFRVTKILDEDNMLLEVESGKPHITAVLSQGSKPKDSISFVNNNEDVDIYSLDICVQGISRWN